jgi:hypothetical protein
LEVSLQLVEVEEAPTQAAVVRLLLALQPLAVLEVVEPEEVVLQLATPPIQARQGLPIKEIKEEADLSAPTSPEVEEALQALGLPPQAATQAQVGMERQ